MRDIYNLFQYYENKSYITEEETLERAKEKISKNLFVHEEFYIGVEKTSSKKSIIKGTELSVHIDEAEFNTRIYICLSKISVHKIQKKFKDINVIFVPISRQEVLRIAELGKSMPYFNIYFLIHGREIVFQAEKIFESMTNEKPFLFYDIKKINHHVPFICKVNIFLFFASCILWIYPKINPIFLHEIGLKENPIRHIDECKGNITITRYRGNAKNLNLERPEKKNFNGGYCIGNKAFYNNPVIETVKLDFEYDRKHTFKNLRSIHRYAFYECPNLRQIDLPCGLEKIFCVAFCNLPSLESLRIPPTVKDLSDGVIYAGCKKLKKVYITESLYRKYEQDFTKRNERDNINVKYIFIDELEEEEEEK